MRIQHPLYNVLATPESNTENIRQTQNGITLLNKKKGTLIFKNVYITKGETLAKIFKGKEPWYKQLTSNGLEKNLCVCVWGEKNFLCVCVCV